MMYLVEQDWNVLWTKRMKAVNRRFSVSSARFICGELSAGKRNRLCVSMEQRVFMKLNRQLLSKLSC